MSTRRSIARYDPTPPNDFPSERADAAVVAASTPTEPVILDGEEYEAGDEVPLDVAEAEWSDRGGKLAVFDDAGRRVDRGRYDDRYFDLAPEAREWYDSTYRWTNNVRRPDHMGFQQLRRWFAEGKR